MCSKYRYPLTLLLYTISILLLLAGILLSFLSTAYVNYNIRNSIISTLTITPEKIGQQTFLNPQDNSKTDIVYSIYLYEVENAYDLQVDGKKEKPILKQKGPYNYYKKNHYYDVSLEMNNNNYKYRSYISYEPTEDNNAKSDVFTSINPFYIAVATKAGSQINLLTSLYTGAWAKTYDSVYADTNGKFQQFVKGSMISVFLNYASTVINSLNTTIGVSPLEQWYSPSHKHTLQSYMKSESSNGSLLYNNPNAFTNFEIYPYGNLTLSQATAVFNDNTVYGLLSISGLNNWMSFNNSNCITLPACMSAVHALGDDFNAFKTIGNYLKSFILPNVTTGSIPQYFLQTTHMALYYNAVDKTHAPTETVNTMGDFMALQFGQSLITKGIGFGLSLHSINPLIPINEWMTFSTKPFNSGANPIFNPNAKTLSIDQSKDLLKIYANINSFFTYQQNCEKLDSDPNYKSTFDKTYPYFSSITSNVNAMIYFLYEIQAFSSSFVNPLDPVQPLLLNTSSGTYSDNGGLFVRRSAHEFIWGYLDDPLSKYIPATFSGTFGPNFKNVEDYTAYYAAKNRTAPYSSKKTGLGGISGTGEYVTNNDLPWFTYQTDIGNTCPSTGPCTVWRRPELVAGSNDGQSFTPLLADGNAKFTPSVLKIYEDSAFRVLNMTYEYDVNVNGINLHRYMLNKASLESQDINPDNANYYMNVLSGVAPLAIPYNGLPLYISMPNFFNADVSFANQFNGLPASDMETCGSWIDVEPWTGKTMNAYKRLQVNFGISQSAFTSSPFKGNYYNIFNSSNYVWPSGWSQESATINQDDANTFISQIYDTPTRVKTFSLSFIIVGSILLAISLFIMVFSYYTTNNSSNSNNGSELLLENNNSYSNY